MNTISKRDSILSIIGADMEPAAKRCFGCELDYLQECYVEWLKDDPDILKNFVAGEEAEKLKTEKSRLKAMEDRRILKERAMARQIELEREQAERVRTREFRELSKRIDLVGNSIPETFQPLTFEKSPSPVHTIFAVNYWTGDEETPSRCGLFLHGTTGFGKTGAAWLVVQDKIDNDLCRTWYFLKSVEFVRLAKGRHLSSDAREEFNEILARAKTTQLLVLDDLATEKLADSAEEVLFELLDCRTEHRAWTVITSNLTMAEVSQTFSAKNRAKIERRLNKFFAFIDFDQRA